MTVQQILDSKGTNVITAPPPATIREIVRLLEEHNIGSVVISSDEVSVAGIVSERDIVRALADHDGDVLDRPASALMSRDVMTCQPGDDLRDVMAWMTERRFRHCPVLDNGRLAGIVSIGDVVKIRMDEVVSEAEQLRLYITS